MYFLIGVALSVLSGPYVLLYIILFCVFGFKRVKRALIALVVTLAFSFVLTWLVLMVLGSPTYYSFFPWTDCIEEYGYHCPHGCVCYAAGAVTVLICTIVKFWQTVSIFDALAIIILPPVIRRFRVGKKGDRLKR